MPVELNTVSREGPFGNVVDCSSDSGVSTFGGSSTTSGGGAGRLSFWGRFFGGIFLVLQPVQTKNGI